MTVDTAKIRVLARSPMMGPNAGPTLRMLADEIDALRGVLTRARAYANDAAEYGPAELVRASGKLLREQIDAVLPAPAGASKGLEKAGKS